VRKERSRVPRALLQPLNATSALAGAEAAELATLTAVDARADPVTLIGEGLLCGLYLNELVLRMTMRMDPQAELFDCYERTLGRLASGESHAWTLRRFERDLLVHLGYGLTLATERTPMRPWPLIWTMRTGTSTGRPSGAALRMDRGSEVRRCWTWQPTASLPTKSFRRCAAGCALRLLRTWMAENCAHGICLAVPRRAPAPEFTVAPRVLSG
jgi:hypothetical protein